VESGILHNLSTSHKISILMGKINRPATHEAWRIDMTPYRQMLLEILDQRR
jgi:hypothetical protein